MINRVVLVGRLVADPELRYTPNGVAVANFRLAVNRPFTNEQGEREADFINCVIWRKPAENLANYQKKGNLIGIDGRIQTRSYDGQDGKRVFVTEIVAEQVQFLEFNKNEGESTRSNQNVSQGQKQVNDNSFENQGEPVDINSDDLPF